MQSGRSRLTQFQTAAFRRLPINLAWSVHRGHGSIRKRKLRLSASEQELSNRRKQNWGEKCRQSISWASLLIQRKSVTKLKVNAERKAEDEEEEGKNWVPVSPKSIKPRKKKESRNERKLCEQLSHARMCIWHTFGLHNAARGRFYSGNRSALALLNDEAEWRREKKQKVLPTLLYRFGSLNDFHCVSLSPTRRRALYR